MFKKILLVSLFFTFALHADEELMQNEIKHVVILLLENRSFDNVLGWLYSETDAPENFVPGSVEPKFLGLSEEMLGQYINELRNSRGELVFSSPPVKGTPSLEGTGLMNSPKFDPQEVFDHVTVQLFNGNANASMKGFLQDYATLWKEIDWIDQQSEITAVMETYTDKQLPVFYGLARHYAVSDYYFSSVPTQTNPNRAFSICGTSDGQIVNGFLGISNFTSDTVWNRLNEESPETSWTIFWQADAVPLLYPGPLSGTNLFSRLHQIPNLDTHFQRFNEFHRLATAGQLPDISYLEPLWTQSINMSFEEKKALKNAAKEELIIGLQGNDCHPPGDTRTAENLLANIYTSLTANEEAWNKTLWIIVFDEHGGLFDHITPPAAIPPDSQMQNGFKFDRYGVRVPAIFISPRIQPKTIVRSDRPEIPFDHASIVATLLKWKKIDKAKWNLGKRVANAPTFDSMITLKEPRTDVMLPSSEPQVLIENKNDVVQMGDRFYLKNKDGNYLIKSPCINRQYAHVGSKKDRIAYTFTGCSGPLTVGSFALIECCDKSLGEKKFLQTSLQTQECTFDKNSANSNQWWTIKCEDNSCVGAKIRYGDKIYLENHTYYDLVQYVPSRLVKTKGLFGTYVKTEPMTQKEAKGDYWILEKL